MAHNYQGSNSTPYTSQYYHSNHYPPEQNQQFQSEYNNNQHSLPALPPGAGIGIKTTGNQNDSIDYVIPKEKAPSTSTFRILLNSLNSQNQLLFLFTVLVQAVVILTMIGLIYSAINNGIGRNVAASTTFTQDPKIEVIATYLSLFILAVFFQLVVLIDALLQKNILQVGLLLVFQIAILIYSAVLPHQLYVAILDTKADNPTTQDFVKAYAIVIPAVIGIVSLVMGLLTSLLYREFGWAVFKRIGADLRLKKAYTLYQFFVCILKFDAFFLTGFEIQFLILVAGVPTAEFVLTIVALPIILTCLVLSAFSVRYESRSGTYAFFFLLFLGLAYFFYKLVRIFDPSSGDRYQSAQASLCIFSVISIVLLLMTFIITGFCFANFGQGLKDSIPPYSPRNRIAVSRNDGNSTGEKVLNGGDSSRRMSID